MATRAFSFLITGPNFSFKTISAVSPRGRAQSADCSNDARMNVTIFSPNIIPTQILLPAPNGKYQELLPYSAATFSFRNLSGLNWEASSQRAGSLWMAHTLVNTLVPLGILYPAIVQVELGNRATNRGSGGCIRSVSFTTAAKFLSRGRCASSTIPPSPIKSAISSFALFIISGSHSSSAMAHSTVVAVVSVPPATMSCKQRWLLGSNGDNDRKDLTVNKFSFSSPGAGLLQRHRSSALLGQYFARYPGAPGENPSWGWPPAGAPPRCRRVCGWSRRRLFSLALQVLGDRATIAEGKIPKSLGRPRHLAAQPRPSWTLSPRAWLQCPPRASTSSCSSRSMMRAPARWPHPRRIDLKGFPFSAPEPHANQRALQSTRRWGGPARWLCALGLADHDRSRSIVKDRRLDRSEGSVRRSIVGWSSIDRGRRSVRERDGISIALSQGEEARGKLLPLTRQNFRHEERREENFSFFVSVSLSLARPGGRSSPSPSPSGVLLSPSSPFSLSLIFSSLDQRSESEEFSFHQRIQLSGQPIWKYYKKTVFTSALFMFSLKLWRTEAHRQCADCRVSRRRWISSDGEASDEELLREQESKRECERAKERERAREREWESEFNLSELKLNHGNFIDRSQN